jgi:hypothetical protein
MPRFPPEANNTESYNTKTNILEDTRSPFDGQAPGEYRPGIDYTGAMNRKWILEI